MKNPDFAKQTMHINPSFPSLLLLLLLLLHHHHLHHTPHLYMTLVYNLLQDLSVFLMSKQTSNVQ